MHGYSGASFIFVALLAAWQPAAAQRETPPPPGVVVAEVRTAPLADRIEALGTLRANESVELTASVTETVTAIHFDDGDRVQAGEVLVEMTSEEEHALLEEAQATVSEARQQYGRVRSLAKQGTAAKSLLDERRRQWETARARLAAIESRLADRLVKAPFAGVVGLRNISLGTLVEPGDLITTLDDDRVMKLDFPVPSTYLATLAPRLGIVATAAAYGDREFGGEVTAIDSRIDPATRSVMVRAVLANPERLLRPGMLMQVELLRNHRSALVIPEEALMPLGEEQFVLVVNAANGNMAERRRIVIGTRLPGIVEVTEGLAAGEKVITQGTLKARPGQPVTIRAVDDGSGTLHELLEPATGGSKNKDDA